MRCAMTLFIIIMGLIAVATFMTAASTRIEEETKSDFEYEQKFEMARYWSRIFCHTIKRSTTIFLDVYHTNQSYETHSFFNTFISGLYKTRLRCINAISPNSYNIQNWSNENVRKPWLRELSGCFTSNLPISMPIPQVESSLFNNPMFPRFIIIPLEAVDYLMEHVFNHWDHKQYVVIFIVSENDDEIMKMCIDNIEEVLLNVAMNILEGLWKRYGAYNVFLGFSLLGFPESRLWSYDPFYRDNISKNPGRIVAVNSMKQFTSKQIRDFQGYKLNIGLFEGRLTAEIRSKKSHAKNYHPVIKDFHGVDGYIVQTMCKHFNFTVNIVPPSGGVKYGYVQNGTAVGTLGDVAYRRIDASFNSQYVKEYINENQQYTTSLNIQFTVPVDWDRVCIIVPSSEEIPRWLRTFIYMQPAIWACLLVAIILATIVWHLLRNYHPSASKNYAECDKNYLAVFIETFILLVGAPIRSTNVLGERCLIGALAFLGLTIMGAFTGTLYHSFTNEMYYRPIGTLKELDISGLTIATSSPNLENIFGPKNPPDLSSTLSRLAQKVKSLPNNSESTIRRTAYKRNTAAIYREKVFLIEQHQYVNSKGRSLLHLVPDCPQLYYLAYLLPVNSIFLDSFNSIITALNEAGITLYWNEYKIQQLSKNRVEHTVNGVTDRSLDEPKPFSIKDMEICFLILAFGLVISIIVFMIECINFKKLRHILLARTFICSSDK